MVEVAGNDQVAGIANKARDPEWREPFEIESPIVDRRDTVRSKRAVEILEMAVEVAEAAPPRLAPIEQPIHDPSVVHRQALVVRTVDQVRPHVSPEPAVAAAAIRFLERAMTRWSIH